MASRLSRTGHENRFVNSLSDYGLAAEIPLSFVDVGLKETHPILSIKDTIQCLDDAGKLDILFQGNGEAQFKGFWLNWERLQPQHPIFVAHRGREGHCIPISIHCDEGTSLKKRQIMIVQLQGTMGKGTRKRKSTEDVPGCNMIGNSIVTRILWSVMLARVYGGKRKNKPLLKMISHLSMELSEAFHQGIQLKQHHLGRIYLVPISMKGDWPALAKIGSLTRHFGRLVTSGKSVGKGICHLCQADRPGFENWHNLTYDNMVKMHDNAPFPWTEEPSLVAAIPLNDCDKAAFFRFDIFHALHKGFMGDIAANATVSWTLWGQYVPLFFKKKRGRCSNVDSVDFQLCLQVCLYDQAVFGDLSFENFCEVCFAEFKTFCAKESKTLHMSGLSRTLLGFGTSSDYPTAKLC